MTLDLDDIADRYNIADDGSRPGDSKSLADTLAREDAALQEALRKTGAELFRTDSTVSDTGQYNRLTSSSQSSTPSFSSSAAAAAPPANPDYYIYDKESYNESYAVPQAKNLFGANLDVLATLGDEDNIQFESMGDSSLRNAIAYIVPWQRASSSSRTQAASPTPTSPRSNFFTELSSNLFDFDLGDLGTFDTTDLGLDLDTSFIPSWNPSESLWSANTQENLFSSGTDYFIGDDKKGNLSSDYFTKYIQSDEEGQSSIATSEAEKRQASVSSEIPMGWRQGILAGGRFLAGQLIEDTTTGGFVDTALLQGAKLLDTPSGPVYLGNANGLINQALDIANIFGINVPRGLTTSVPPNLQSNRSKLEGFTTRAKPTNGMWQFLFNPSELVLSAGPKFKATETWGVSDEANTGQPLHWTNNSNAKLQFSKVLLNGYIFGKKVESLEQGLFKLFLENPTNDAKHGPRVLEFVWGKRSFGPCVIKDIRVNEKMWDEGCLVSAEVSFTLEKVPEWTINDGQVSTFDPTAHPVSASPTKTTQEEAREPDEKEKPQPEPEAEPEPSTSTQKCAILKTGIDNVDQLIRNGDYYKKRVLNFGKQEFFGSSFLGEPGIDPDIALSKMSSQYVNWNSRTNVKGFIASGTSQCGVPSLNKEKEKINKLPDYVGFGGSRAQNAKKMRDAVALIGTYQKCIKEREGILKKQYKDGKCK